MDAAKLVKYEAWIHELEARQRDHAARRPSHLRLFAAIAAVSVVGFAWNAWVGIGALLTGVMCALFGIYVINVREGDYERELRHARREVAELRARLAAPLTR